jgi:hypothetical protein
VASALGQRLGARSGLCYNENALFKEKDNHAF